MKQSTVWSYASFTCLAFYVVWHLSHLHWPCSLRGIFMYFHTFTLLLSPLDPYFGSPLKLDRSYLSSKHRIVTLLHPPRITSWKVGSKPRQAIWFYVTVCYVCFFFLCVFSRDWVFYVFFLECKFTHDFLPVSWFFQLVVKPEWFDERRWWWTWINRGVPMGGCVTLRP